TKTRYEVVIEGTDEAQIRPGTVWREYGFKGKPGDPHRRPPHIAPYHLRLDWLMWFAALSSVYAHPWFVPLAHKLLDGDRATRRLLRDDPFPDTPPTFVRAVLYSYRLTTWRERRTTGAWWDRTPVGPYLPPIGRGPVTGR
ncbi:MAG: lipase maturation factor family protein, partial [Nocardioidaceae bacterium]